MKYSEIIEIEPFFDSTFNDRGEGELLETVYYK